jgi:hypothetical protein
MDAPASGSRILPIPNAITKASSISKGIFNRFFKVINLVPYKVDLSK